MVDHPFDLIEVERRCLLETGNPMHAWAAYSLARVNDAPIPDWVLRYFDMCSSGLRELAMDAKADDGRNLGPKIAKAMGLASDGSGTPLATYHSDWLVHGMHVRARLPGCGGKEYLAIEEVAAQAGVGKATVRRSFKKYSRLFPGSGIIPDEALD